MKIEDALNYLCKQADAVGADQYDAVAGVTDTLGIEIYQGKVKDAEISSSCGVGIRLFKNGRPGYSYTERLEKESLQQSVRDALDLTRLTDSLNIRLPAPSYVDTDDLELFNAALEDYSIADMKLLGLSIENALKERDKRITNIPYLGVSRSSRRSFFQNSEQLQFEIKGNSISAYAGATASASGVDKMGMYGNGGRSANLDCMQPDYIALQTAERTLELLGARPIASARMPVVLSNRISGRLMAMFASSYYAENVQKGLSRLASRMGEQIADPCFSLYCRPHIRGAPGSRNFDGEGVVCHPLDVVESGTLQNYLYNLESAAREDKVPSGHGSRGYSGKAGASFSNMIVPAGTNSLPELLRAYPRLVHIVKLEGGSGCSAISGEISIGIQGFLYENGEKIHAIDQMTMSTNYFDLLLSLRAVSKEYSDAFSSIRVPDLLVAEVDLSA